MLNENNCLKLIERFLKNYMNKLITGNFLKLIGSFLKLDAVIAEELRFIQSS